MDRDEARHAAAHLVLAAHQAAGALRRAHRDIDVRRRNDRAEVDPEAVRKHQGRAGLEVVAHVTHVRRGLLLIGDQDHRDVGALHRVGHLGDLDTVAHGAGARSRVGAQSDDHLAAGITQVERVRSALASVTDDRDRLSLDGAAVDVAVVDGFHGSSGLGWQEKNPSSSSARGLLRSVTRSVYAAAPRRPVRRTTRTRATRPRNTGAINTLLRD